MLELNRKLSLELIDFIQRHQTIDIVDKSFLTLNRQPNSIGSMSSVNSSSVAAANLQVNTNNINNHLFADVNSYLITLYNGSKTIKKSSQSNVVLYPTQCVLFENGTIKVRDF